MPKQRITIKAMIPFQIINKIGRHGGFFLVSKSGVSRLQMAFLVD